MKNVILEDIFHVLHYLFENSYALFDVMIFVNSFMRCFYALFNIAFFQRFAFFKYLFKSLLIF